MHRGDVFSLEQDLSLSYGIIGKSHDGHKERGLARSVGTEQYVCLPFIDVEIDIV